MSFPPIHIIYENPDWLPPLTEALERAGFEQVHLVKLSEGLLDAHAIPPQGIWINRISPSSHTRGNHHTVQLARELLSWLELHNRIIINGLKAFELEMSKFRQDLALRKYGIKTPKTILAVGDKQLKLAALQFEGPFITKHNQGGKGLGIQLFNSAEEFNSTLESNGLEESPDGKFILQQYIKPANGHITRVELVGNRFLLAMNSSTKGGFELCPSDVCQLKAAQRNPDVCPIDGQSDTFSASDLSSTDPLVLQYLQLLQGEDIDVAGIEFVEDELGNRYTYDINGTTNYNAKLGSTIGINGMQELARYLKDQIVPKWKGQRHRRASK